MVNNSLNASLKITQDQCTLRDFTIDDIKNKVLWINNKENNTYLHYDLPLSIDRTKEWFLARNLNSRKDLLIEYDLTPVGIIGLVGIDFNNKKAEYYITIGDNRFKHKGVATIATRLLLTYAFNILNLNKIYLNVDEKNINACKLYEKVGFKQEGFFREDMIVKEKYINRLRFGILKSEFIA